MRWNRIKTLLFMVVGVLIGLAGLVGAEEISASSVDMAAQLSEIKAGLASQKVAADTVWVLVTGMLVFFMNLGFALV